MACELRLFLVTLGANELADKLLADEIDDFGTLNELSRDELRQMYGVSLGMALKIKAGLRARASHNDSDRCSTREATKATETATVQARKLPRKKDTWADISVQDDDTLSCVSCESSFTSSTDTTSWRSTTSSGYGSPSKVLPIGLPLRNIVKPKNSPMGDDSESCSTYEGSSYHNGSDSEQSRTSPAKGLANDVVSGDCDPARSVGSQLHELGICRPCHYYATKAGCTSGKNCKFCHCSHKKTRKSKKEKKPTNKEEQEFFNTDDELELSTPPGTWFPLPM